MLGGLGVERGPDEARELAGDGDDGLGSRLALGEQAVEATVKPVNGLVGESHDFWWLALTLALQARGARVMTIVPSRLDQQAPGMTVASLGDRPAPLALGRREFGGDEAEEGHQAAGGVEAHEVVQIRHESHGGDGVDATEAAQGPNRSA